MLEYNTPLTTDTTADLVFGQGSFSASACADGIGADPTLVPTHLCARTTSR